MAGGPWDGIPVTGNRRRELLKQGATGGNFLSGRAVINPTGFLEVVSLASPSEDLCTVRFCVEPGAGNSDPAEDKQLDDFHT